VRFAGSADSALLRESVETMLTGDMETGKAVLRDYINVKTHPTMTRLALGPMSLFYCGNSLDSRGILFRATTDLCPRRNSSHNQ
jgi:hypothetical protein